jgi:hypothetical protein
VVGFFAAPPPPRQVSQYRSHYIEAEHPRTTPCWPREGFAQTSRTRARTSAGGVRTRWTARERTVCEYASDDETSSSLSWPTAAAPPGARTTCSAAAAAADEDCNIISKRTANRNLAEQPRSRKGQRGGGGIFAPSLPPSPQASPQAKAWHPLHREGAEESNHIRTVDAYESGKYSTHAPTTFQLIGAGYISDTAV